MKAAARLAQRWVAGMVVLAAACAGFAQEGVGHFRAFGMADASIQLSAGAFERGTSVTGTLLLSRAVNPASAKLAIRVTDSFGRLLVDNEEQMGRAGSPPPRVTNDSTARVTRIPFTIAVPAVQVMRHSLSLSVTGGESAPQTATASFIYRPSPVWDDYVCAIWQRHNPARLPFLQEMYLSGSQWNGNNPTAPDWFTDANYRWYVETTGTLIFAPYHMWMSDNDNKTFYFEQARKAFFADRTDRRVLERNPCLSNHLTTRLIDQMFTSAAKINRDYRPWFYTVADETGIANQASPFDFCFSPDCQAAFRVWLKERYPTLEALNAEWGSTFTDWESVRGATTDEIFARTNENYAAWADHKDFMDTVLCNAYARAGKAVKAVDSTARIGMGGGQGPSPVGGWDFWKLTQSLDVMENYAIGSNYEFLRSFNPNVIGIHCTFGGGNWELHNLYYLFLHGDRMALVWDDASDYVDDKGQYSPRALEAKPLYEELTGGIGKLRIASRRVDDPIALYHSQANLRMHWLREVKPAGKDWINRQSWSERKQSRYFRLRESWIKLIEDNGFQWRMLCPEQVALGQLKVYDPKTGEGFKVLLLPEILALSAAEAKAIADFVAAGGTVIADTTPGLYDGHCRKLESPALSSLFAKPDNPRVVLLDTDLLEYYHLRMRHGHAEADMKELLGRHLLQGLGGARQTPAVAGPDGKPLTGVEVTQWRNGQARIIAVQRNPQLFVHELGETDYTTNKRFEKPEELTMSLASGPTVAAETAGGTPAATKTGSPKAVGAGVPPAHPMTAHWVDIRAGKTLGAADTHDFQLDPYMPSIFAVFPGPLQPFTAKVEHDQLVIAPFAGAGMETYVYHLAFIGPDGKERLPYRANVACGVAGGSFELPLALNDMAGTWTVRIREVATGCRVNVAWEKGPAIIAHITYAPIFKTTHLRGMEVSGFKRDFGDRLAYYGSNDLITVLSRGSPDEMRREVHKNFRMLGAAVVADWRQQSPVDDIRNAERKSVMLMKPQKG